MRPCVLHCSESSFGCAKAVRGLWEAAAALTGICQDAVLVSCIADVVLPRLSAFLGGEVCRQVRLLPTRITASLSCHLPTPPSTHTANSFAISSLSLPPFAALATPVYAWEVWALSPCCCCVGAREVERGGHAGMTSSLPPPPVATGTYLNPDVL